jgi:hypothetical protein
MHSSPTSYRFTSLLFKYSPQHPVPKHPPVYSYVPPLISETKFCTHREAKAKL